MHICHFACAEDGAGLMRISDSLLRDGGKIGAYHLLVFWRRNEPVRAICPDGWTCDHVEHWLLRDNCAQDGKEDWFVGVYCFVASV